MTTLDVLTAGEKRAALATVGGDRLVLIPDPLYDDWDEAKHRAGPGYQVIAYCGSMSLRVGIVYDARVDRSASRRPKTPAYIYRPEPLGPHQQPAYDEDYPDGNPWENEPVDTWTPED